MSKRHSKIDWNGCPRLPLKERKLRGMIRTVLSETACYITATTNGIHTAGSWHYRKKAADCGSGGPGERPEIKAQELLLSKYGVAAFEELFGPAGWYVKQGHKYPGTFPGHGDHLHLVPRQ